jgi:iron complex outermembrane receptor protein
LTILLLALAWTGGGRADAQSLPDLSLEQLMRLDAGRVFGASERSQPVTEAPASVSFITADDIERYGYRTLADILHGVRGLYVSDDRNFSLLGARGFGKPGDYNSRILLLINGHRVNDNAYGQAEIGAEFGLDPALIERVEVIRGPASALYGDSAFFGVVNVITRTGASIAGDSVTYEVGSQGTQLVRGVTGRRLAGGVDFALSATLERSDGADRLYFPAFDAPETNFGVAEGLDGQGLAQYYGRLAVGNFTLTGAYGHRRKDVPTASFGSLFNEQVDPERTIDRHALLDLEYSRAVGRSRLAVRGSYDRFTAEGYYPMDGAFVGVPKVVGRNDVVGEHWTVDGRLTRPLPGRQMLTVGAEIIDNVRQRQQSRFLDPPVPLLRLDLSSTQRAVYVQDEIKVGTWLILNGGLRHDAYEKFDRLTPRGAVILVPSTGQQSFKYLYGRAFRAPNTYERNDFYFGDRVHELGPESIDTHELVWERYSADWLRTSVSAYWYKADQLITQAVEPLAFFGTTYVNEGEVRARGLELEAQMRLPAGAESHMSYALQRAEDQETGLSLVNSPRQIGKLRVSAPLFGDPSSVALEVLALGSRQTLDGNTLGTATTAHLTVTRRLGNGFSLFGTARNLFDVDYAVPASKDHLQDDIPQNGRTFRVGLSWTRR